VPAGDFLLLLCASQQWQVFSAERTEEWQLMAGLNTDHLELQLGEPSAVPNFIYCRSYLDMLKVAVFRYLFWLVLVVVFVTGATRISIFGLGYLLACFYLLLFGTSLLQKHTRTRLVLWDCLILLPAPAPVLRVRGADAEQLLLGHPAFQPRVHRQRLLRP